MIRFNGLNYSAWAFHFKIFVKGKELWGHVDGSNPAPDKIKDIDQHAKWEVKDAQVMAWILRSIEPNIILNLRSSQIAAQMWTYLKKIYSQQNTARRFQLEHELSTLQQDSLSISDFYSRFTNLWTKYTDIVYTGLPFEGLSSVQSVHETTQRDQFLMKMRPEFEGTRSNLMNREFVPPWIHASVTSFAKNNAFSLKPPWNNDDLHLFLWLMQHKVSQEAGIWALFNVFVVRDLAIMLQIVLENLQLLQKRWPYHQRMPYSTSQENRDNIYCLNWLFTSETKCSYSCPIRDSCHDSTNDHFCIFSFGTLR